MNAKQQMCDPKPVPARNDQPRWLGNQGEPHPRTTRGTFADGIGETLSVLADVGCVGGELVATVLYHMDLDQDVKEAILVQALGPREDGHNVWTFWDVLSD